MCNSVFIQTLPLEVFNLIFKFYMIPKSLWCQIYLNERTSFSGIQLLSDSESRFSTFLLSFLEYYFPEQSPVAFTVASHNSIVKVRSFSTKLNLYSF